MSSGKATDTDALVEQMKATKAQWDAEASDETDALLSQAISMAIDQGKGWAPGEREKYLETLLDDDFIPPLFATSKEELEKSGLAEAFQALHDEGETPGKNMLEFRMKGNESIALGRKNVAKNMSVSIRCFVLAINTSLMPGLLLTSDLIFQQSCAVLSRCCQPLLRSIPLG
jgi:hypothetical protein